MYAYFKTAALCSEKITMNNAVTIFQSYAQDYPHPHQFQTADFFHTKYDNYLNIIHLKQNGGITGALNNLHTNPAPLRLNSSLIINEIKLNIISHAPQINNEYIPNNENVNENRNDNMQCIVQMICCIVAYIISYIYLRLLIVNYENRESKSIYSQKLGASNTSRIYGLLSDNNEEKELENSAIDVYKNKNQNSLKECRKCVYKRNLPKLFPHININSKRELKVSVSWHYDPIANNNEKDMVEEYNNIKGQNLNEKEFYCCMF